MELLGPVIPLSTAWSQCFHAGVFGVAGARRYGGYWRLGGVPPSVPMLGPQDKLDCLRAGDGLRMLLEKIIVIDFSLVLILGSEYETASFQ